MLSTMVKAGLNVGECPCPDVPICCFLRKNEKKNCHKVFDCYFLGKNEKE